MALARQPLLNRVTATLMHKSVMLILKLMNMKRTMMILVICKRSKIKYKLLTLHQVK